MVFLNLRSGSKAGLLFHSKHASRRNARGSNSSELIFNDFQWLSRDRESCSRTIFTREYRYMAFLSAV
jgi:hypothetical protein